MALLHSRGEHGLIALLKPLYLSPRCRGPYISPSNSAGRREFTSYEESFNPHERYKDVAVLGGGITGLTSAYYLTQKLPNARITLYESSNRLGGWVESTRMDVDDGYVIFESGPRTLRSAFPNGPVTYALLFDLGLLDKVLPTPTLGDPQPHDPRPHVRKANVVPQSRYIYYPDHLVRLPGPGAGLMETVMAFSREPLLQGLPWNVVKEWNVPAAPVEDESVGSFFSRRFGPDLVNNILSAVMHGIYAGDVWQLSVKSITPHLPHLEKSFGGVLKGYLQHQFRKFSDNRAAGPRAAQIERRYAKLEDAKMLNNLIQEINQSGRPFPLQPKKLSRVYTLEGGLETLAKTLESRLRGNPNVHIKTNTTIAKVIPENTMGKGNAGQIRLTTTTNQPQKPFNHVISTIPGPALHALTAPSLPSLAQTPSVTVMVVNFLFQSPPERLLPVRGFGYLIPRSIPLAQNPERALGVIFDSDATPYLDTTSGAKLTVMLGGHWWDGWKHYPTAEEGFLMAGAVLDRHLGIREQPKAWNINLQKNCIPQYTVGHNLRMYRARNELKGEKWGGLLSVAGSGYDGVGVNDCVRGAWDVVRRLARSEVVTGLDRFSGVDEDWTWMSRKRDQWIN